jgi:hypothetical protein
MIPFLVFVKADRIHTSIKKIFTNWNLLKILFYVVRLFVDGIKRPEKKGGRLQAAADARLVSRSRNADRGTAVKIPCLGDQFTHWRGRLTPRRTYPGQHVNFKDWRMACSTRVMADASTLSMLLPTSSYPLVVCHKMWWTASVIIVFSYNLTTNTIQNLITYPVHRFLGAFTDKFVLSRGTTTTNHLQHYRVIAAHHE